MRNLLKIGVLLLTASFAYAQNAKLGRDLKGINPNSNVDVIIQFTHVPTAADNQWVRSLGGVVVRQYGKVKAGLYTVPASALNQLASNPDVTFITPDRTVKAQQDPTPPR